VVNLVPMPARMAPASRDSGTSTRREPLVRSISDLILVMAVRKSETPLKFSRR